MGGIRTPNRSAVLRVLLLVAAVVVVASCNQQPTGRDNLVPDFFPPAAGTDRAQAINALYPIIFWIATAIFVLVEGLVIFIVLRFRRRPGTTDELPVQTHGSNVLEIIWTVIPALIVAAVFVMTVVTLDRVEARSPNPDVTVDVTGFQWQWTLDYRDQGLSFTGQGDKGPEMVIPVGQTVRVRLHSNDVVHAFYVPHFLYKKDVVPGRVNQIDFTMTAPATYVGQCAEFCGLAHAQMFFSVRGVPPAEFQQWVQTEQAKARATPPPAPSPGAGQSAQPASVPVSASNSQSFDQPEIEAPAGVPVTFEFQNNDPAAPHNVAVREATSAGDFIGQPVAPPGQRASYQGPALEAGQYTFYCSVHPNMQGTLTVK